MSEDLLGRELTEMETELLALYEHSKTLLSRDDLPPCVEANVRAATVGLAHAVNDLALRYEHLTDLGA